MRGSKPGVSRFLPQSGPPKSLRIALLLGIAIVLTKVQSFQGEEDNGQEVQKGETFPWVHLPTANEQYN